MMINIPVCNLSCKYAYTYKTKKLDYYTVDEIYCKKKFQYVKSDEYCSDYKKQESQ